MVEKVYTCKTLHDVEKVYTCKTLHDVEKVYTCKTLHDFGLQNLEFGTQSPRLWLGGK
jgi:hypothetical protein